MWCILCVLCRASWGLIWDVNVRCTLGWWKLRIKRTRFRKFLGCLISHVEYCLLQKYERLHIYECESLRCLVNSDYFIIINSCMGPEELILRVLRRMWNKNLLKKLLTFSRTSFEQITNVKVQGCFQVLPQALTTQFNRKVVVPVNPNVGTEGISYPRSRKLKSSLMRYKSVDYHWNNGVGKGVIFLLST